MGSSEGIMELQRNSTNWSKVVEEIVKMERKIFPKHESLARSFDEELKKKNSALLYLYINGQVVGYVMYSWPSSLFASITKLAVKESCRRQGHGEALLKAAIEKCRSRNVSRIMLHVDTLRTAAMNLYKKLGFQVDALTQGYYSPDRHAYRMVWQKHMGEFAFGDDSDGPAPWFIYTFLGLGVTLCVIACSGHIAAETFSYEVNLNLSIASMEVYFLESDAVVTADVFLNRDWEEDFPEDPSGSFTQFKDFIRSNFQFCKWIGLSIVSVQFTHALHMQGLSFLLAMVLKVLRPDRYYDSDDEYAPDRVPLLRNFVHPPTYVVGDPVYGSKTDAWTIRINEKVEMLYLSINLTA
ncbi:hypothetical protein Patl1_02226 [Pistacia atlantica]|uniref:Uncharacterized protein n=1 Tax=Pistacia atlantica TaxID=434234 RepID=A0ACC1C9E1_9ROSI|nr:hypothetical protein Patl1_02226 [Pistacia atlantica]